MPVQARTSGAPRLSRRRLVGLLGVLALGVIITLLWIACRNLYGSFGWPLLTTVVICLVYLSIKHPSKAVFLIIPLIAFYLIIIVNIRMFLPRYLLAGFIGLALLAGKGCADWLRYNKLHVALRLAPVALAYCLSLFYCIGIDLEMLSDTRVRTEQWFADNVPRPGMVGAGIYNRVYAPRLHLKGYNMICPWKSSSTPGGSSSYPDYLIMSPDWQRGKEDAEDEFREELFDGQLSYEQVARFTPKYLYPARSIVGLAGWPIPKTWILSPEIIVFKKKPKAGGDIGQRRGADPTR
jgi:hypothetical protein